MAHSLTREFALLRHAGVNVAGGLRVGSSHVSGAFLLPRRHPSSRAPASSRDDVTMDVATVGLTRTKSLGLAAVIRVSAVCSMTVHVEV